MCSGFLVAVSGKHKERYIYSILPEAEVSHVGDFDINPLLNDQNHCANPACPTLRVNASLNCAPQAPHVCHPRLGPVISS